MAAPSAAVILERASKSYGRKEKPVLLNLDMTVEKGTIYGLLGPSGCGKTTLLSCIVGRRKLDSGNIWVLGGKPGEKGSGVPGPRVGYMPQDLALVGEFTVKDAIFYFGRIYGMDKRILNERFEFLSTLLDLPSAGRFVKKLSGGQQRRVSLAAALVHEPELLILDEPTVGLDPVLRERIWDCLAELARGGTAVIITTHYIDETKQAHKIGLLRDGQLLAEDSPEEILRRFDCTTLEEAFLKLTVRQHQLPRRPAAIGHALDVIQETQVPAVDSRYQSSESFNVVTSSTDVLTTKDEPKSNYRKSKARSRYKAVFIKSFQQFIRNPEGLILSIMFPIIQVVLFFTAIGHDPRDLKLAVVNEEAGSSPYGLDICKNSSLQVAKVVDGVCDTYMLSCWFLEDMEKRNIYQVPYNTTEEAKGAVVKGQLYGALHIGPNFSEALIARVSEGHVDDDVVSSSTVSIWLDMTNQQISNFLKSQLHKTYESFTKRTMKACGNNENLVQIPVHFHEPIYGDPNEQMVGYLAPGVMVTIIFFLPTIVTTSLMISDRLEGVWERSAVAGVKPNEMLYVHITLQTVVIFIQTLEMLALSFGCYGLPSRGSLITTGTLLFLQGLSGMCYGFLLSIFCSSYSLAFFVSCGSFYPIVMLCGILWPLEAMSDVLRYIAYALPFTIPSMSLRDIIEKGYDIWDPSVYQGFLVTIAWIIITLAVCLVRLRCEKK